MSTAPVLASPPAALTSGVALLEDGAVARWSYPLLTVRILPEGYSLLRCPSSESGRLRRGSRGPKRGGIRTCYGVEVAGIFTLFSR